MAGNGDIREQRQTYESVMGLLKWGAVASFIIAFIVIYLIAG